MQVGQVLYERSFAEHSHALEQAKRRVAEECERMRKVFVDGLEGQPQAGGIEEIVDRSLQLEWKDANAANGILASAAWEIGMTRPPADVLGRGYFFV